MLAAYNVFDPDDLDLAQAIFDDIWASLPDHIRSSARSGQCRDWLAKRVLSAIKHDDDAASCCLKERLKDADLSLWS